MSNTALMRRGDFGDADLARFSVEKYAVRKSSTRINGHAIFCHGVLAVALFLLGFNDVAANSEWTFWAVRCTFGNTRSPEVYFCGQSRYAKVR